MPVDSAADVEPSLADELSREGIELPAKQVALLGQYCHVLWEWNEKLNLTRHTDFHKFVSRDLVDTLAIGRHLELNERVLDVGTGGGVPGVVLAILRPDLQLHCANRSARSRGRVAQIVQQLRLSAPVHATRAEELLASHRFDTLVARAVAPLSKMLVWFAPHWNNIGRLLVIKGPAWVEERHEAREKNLFKDLQLRKLATWPLPGTHSESVLLEIRPKQGG